MDIEVPKDKYISRGVDWENLTCIDQTASETVHIWDDNDE